MKRSLLSALAVGFVVCSFAGRASAQTQPPPADGSAPPPRRAWSPPPSGSTSGAGAFGLGGIVYLSGQGGLSLAYDPGPWHIDTMLGLSGGGGARNDFHFGGRFWYHVSSMGSADFSLGAGAAYQHLARQNVALPAVNNLFIELGALIRVFLVRTVALSAGTGLVIWTADASGYAIGPSSLVGNAALHYFF
jgi:hypothetical protein